MLDNTTGEAGHPDAKQSEEPENLVDVHHRLSAPVMMSVTATAIVAVVTTTAVLDEDAAGNGDADQGEENRRL
jgi:hypothetical protein